MMRRFVIGAILGSLVIAVSVATVAADTTCPKSESQFTAYSVNGSLGDPAPAPGEEPLWDAFLAAVESEGLTVEEVAEEAGVASVDELYNLALEGWFGWDKNENRIVCVKPFPPHQNGQPAYFANFIDDNARAKP